MAVDYGHVIAADLTDPASPLTTVVLESQRERCLRCEPIILAVPSDFLPLRHDRAQANQQALALLGLVGWSIPAVRAAVSARRIVGPCAAPTSLPLRRWFHAVASGKLWRDVRPCPTGASSRALAERTASTLAALAPIGTVGTLDHLACPGALRLGS